MMEPRLGQVGGHRPLGIRLLRLQVQNQGGRLLIEFGNEYNEVMFHWIMK